MNGAILKGVGVLLGVWAGVAAAQGQVYSVASTHEFATTIQRFEQALREEGIEPQRDSATTAEADFVFVNPYAASYAGRCRWDDRSDQPFSTRIWRDADGKVNLSYTAPAERVNEFGVIECGSVVAKIHKTLNKIINFAAQ
ncbi:MAG: hypothetical protein OEW08_07955 [Gammaproteobacteria bacterium]|nr:hypothetical protein [Gammaproteobacteria bacterium]